MYWSFCIGKQLTYKIVRETVVLNSYHIIILGYVPQEVYASIPHNGFIYNLGT